MIRIRAAASALLLRKEREFGAGTVQLFKSWTVLCPMGTLPEYVHDRRG